MNPFPGASCFLVNQTASTMNEVRALAEAGFPEGTVVAADYQSAGRGRIDGRLWVSPPGENLLFTLLLAPGAAAEAALPLKAGLALRRTAAAFLDTGAIELKWPNDLLLDGRKAAGIVCEAGPSGVLVGVGLNCNQTVFPPEMDATATSLALVSGRRIDRFAALERFLAEFQAVRRLADWRYEVGAHLWRMGREVSFLVGNPESGRLCRGRVAGIDESGALLLEGLDGTVQAFSSGEISLHSFN